MTAHHADDQAETVLFRLLRGSGVAGLRGMDLATARDGVTIARPLLGLKKRDLVAFAEARGAPFVDDPSNADPRFARTRLRALLVRLGEEGLDAEALDRLARRAGETERGARASDGRSRGARSARKARSTPARSSPRRSRSRSGFWRGASPRPAAATRAGIGLEKIETLAAGLRDALKERRALRRQCRRRARAAHRQGTAEFRARAAEKGRQTVTAYMATRPAAADYPTRLVQRDMAIIADPADR